MNRWQRVVITGLWLAAAGCSRGGDDRGGKTQADAPPAPEAAQAGAPEETSGTPQPLRVDTQLPTGTFDPLKAYDSKCPDDDDDPSLDCEWLRGLVVADVVDALDTIAESRDQRGIDAAIAALDIDDEPEVVIAACRVLGQNPGAPGIAEKLTPQLLDSPYLAVASAAAEVLAANPGQPGPAAMAAQWTTNHRTLSAEDPYDEMPEFPAQYAAMGFPEYPGAQRFTPADSESSVGWWTDDAPVDAAGRLGETLGVAVLDNQQWMQRSQQGVMNAMQSIDQSKVDAIQKLADEWSKTQDPALYERMSKMQEELYAPLQAAGDAMNSSALEVAVPPYAADPDQVRYLIAEEKNGHIARLIMIYRQPVPERTVVQMSWDVRDYPPAWKTGTD